MTYYQTKLAAFYTERIRDGVAELKALCQRAEAARDRDDTTSFLARVSEIEDRRPALQDWYAKRRALARAAEDADTAA